MESPTTIWYPIFTLGYLIDINESETQEQTEWLEAEKTRKRLQGNSVSDVFDFPRSVEIEKPTSTSRPLDEKDAKDM